MIENEYKALRAEIKDWQDRRFIILTASISLVTAILGLKIFDKPSPTEMWPWLVFDKPPPNDLGPWLSALLLFLLSAACFLTWYAGRANAKIAAYIIVFHERSCDGWESRLLRLKGSGLDWLNLNRLLTSIYLVLGLASVIFSVSHCPAASGLAALIVSGIVFSCSLFFLMSIPATGHYIKLWQDLNDKPK